MWNDEVVDDVRKARQANAAAHDNDLGRIFSDLKKKQDESGRTVVTLAPVPPPVLERAAGAKPLP